MSHTYIGIDGNMSVDIQHQPAGESKLQLMRLSKAQGDTMACMTYAAPVMKAILTPSVGRDG